MESNLTKPSALAPSRGAVLGWTKVPERASVELVAADGRVLAIVRARLDSEWGFDPGDGFGLQIWGAFSWCVLKLGAMIKPGYTGVSWTVDGDVALNDIEKRAIELGYAFPEGYVFAESVAPSER